MNAGHRQVGHAHWMTFDMYMVSAMALLYVGVIASAIRIVVVFHPH